MGLDPAWESVFREKGLVSHGTPPHGSLDAVILPMPPSVNNLFPSGKSGKRFQSPEYKAWIVQATPIMRTMKVPDTLPVRYKYTLLGKMRRSNDGGNKEKAIMDLAVSCGIIPDDNLMYVVGGSWSYEPEHGINGVRLELVPVE